MKKAMLSICAVFALVFSLCGCGAAKDTDNVLPTATPIPTVTVTPMITPDIDNGVVTDEDGVIDGELAPDAVAGEGEAIIEAPKVTDTATDKEKK